MRERDQGAPRKLWIAAGALLACTSQQIGVAYDPDEESSTLQTYAWFPRETKT